LYNNFHRINIFFLTYNHRFFDKKEAKLENNNQNTQNKDDVRHWQNRFFCNFLYELNRAEYTPEDISKYVWKPFSPDDLIISGPDRDLSLFKVQTVPAEISRYLNNLPPNQVDSDDYFSSQKLVLILLPGFTHHTLKYPAFIAQDEFKSSPVDLMTIAFAPDGQSIIETELHQGGGVKLMYAAYPRSNASSLYIVPKTIEMLQMSQKLKNFVNEGYKIVFIGYSYGSALGLELLAGLNSGAFEDSFILENTIAFLSINGDIEGSYLADAVLKEDALFNMQKYVKLSEKFNPLGLLMGLKTDQERKDLVGGVQSLAHPERIERLNEYRDKVPPNIKYFSICAFLPEDDYNNSLLKNLDDWTMHKQSLASKDISIYNDGQMVLENCFLPKFPHVPKENIIELGAVRAHHWAVSFRTFNMGVNNFPRFPYYRALGKTLAEAGVINK